MWKKQVLQDPGYVMLYAMLQGCIKYPMLKELKEIKNSHNTVDLRHLSLISKESKSPFNRHYVTAILLMLKESKVHLIYNVDSNSKYLN